LTTAEFLERVGRKVPLAASAAESPARKGSASMYVDGHWYGLDLGAVAPPAGGIAALDVSLLQDAVLDPVLGIKDVRTDKRIEFVGGIRGTAELTRLVDSGAFAVAFSLYPVTIRDLMDIADTGGIMPPKSTWFEPKLRDGLLSHLI
jgi:uncharacterized protein (DUF1015 family)